MQDKPLFREAALKHFSSPEQLDQLIQVVTPRAWIVAGTLYALLFIIILWSIIGTIPTRGEGKGILLAGNGDIYGAVVPQGPSRVSNVLVKPGDKVVKGQIVATMSRPDLTDQIKVSQNYVAELQNKYNQLLTLSRGAVATREQQVAMQQQALQRSLTDSQSKLDNISELLSIKQGAFKKGIETRQSVDQTTQDYYNAKNILEGFRNQLIQLHVEERSFIDQWNQRLRDLDLKIVDEKVKLANLQKALILSSDVASPVAGIVTGVQATLGSILNTGDSVVSVANEGQGLDALVYLPPQIGKRIKPGMKALVAPTTVEKAEYGSIFGHVVRVAAFPSSPQAIESVLQNPDLVKAFTKEESPIEVRIHLEKDPATYSGLKWSSSRGPQQKITMGTLATAMVTIREQAPITLVIPAFRKFTGMEY